MNEANNNSTNPQARCEPSAGSMRVWDGPILASREEVQQGYERGMLSALPGMDGCFSMPSEGRYEFYLWDLWHKGDNPADSDPLKRQINELQSQAGPLSDDDRYIRIQIAVLQRCWREYPKNVDCILVWNQYRSGKFRSLDFL